MALTKKQKELDVIKWEKSIAMGVDACGTFDYCAVCDKSLENPCDKAYTKFNKKAADKPAVKKTVAKKPAAKPVAKKTAEKKPVAASKKPAAKKSK